MKKAVALLLVILSLAAFASSASAKARGYGIIFTQQVGEGHGVKDNGMPSTAKNHK